MVLQKENHYKFLKAWVSASGIIWWICLSIIVYGVYFNGGELCILMNELGEMSIEVIFITLINALWLMGIMVGWLVR